MEWMLVDLALVVAEANGVAVARNQNIGLEAMLEGRPGLCRSEKDARAGSEVLYGKS